MDQEAIDAIQPELTSGERMLWAGRPSNRFVLRPVDGFLIPFSLLSGALTIFWELEVTGIWDAKQHTDMSRFLIIWGIPLVIIGQYLIWGRFFHAAWLKKRTFYAVTSERVIVVQRGLRRRILSAYLSTLPAMTRYGRFEESGTLRFGQPESSWGRRNRWATWNPMTMGTYPVFVDIDDAGYVYQLVSDLRSKAAALAGRPK